MTEEEEQELHHERQQRFQDELDSYRRFLKAMVLMLAFWFVMLYFIAHHDNGLIIAGFVAMALWMVYMCACISGNLYLRFRNNHQNNRRRRRRRRRGQHGYDQGANGDDDDDDDDEEAGLTTTTTTKSRFPVDGMNHGQEEGGFPYPIKDTLTRIHAEDSGEPISPLSKQPTNGTYAAVYSAILFSKTIRTEGQLRLEFFRQKTNGWTIQGQTEFGGQIKPIQKGFVNARGEMVWTTGDTTIYRGILDLESSCLFDGEFGPLGDKGPSGRIVRLELTKAAYYSSDSSTSNRCTVTTATTATTAATTTTTTSGNDVEMVTFSNQKQEETNMFPKSSDTLV